MADIAVAVTTLTANAVGADILTNAEGATQIVAGNVAVIAAKGETRNLLITIYGSGGAATATVAAGDNPPAQRAGLGATSALAIPASDALQMVVEGARFSQDDGTIRITIGTNTCQVSAVRIPDTI
jgi:hypothetical protein